MRELEERIRREALAVLPDILRVDMFLNHMIDPVLLEGMGEEFYRLFAPLCGRVTKILTVEASGIAIACATARRFGVPVLFAKKGLSNKTLDKETYTSVIHSYTKDVTTHVSVARRFLGADDRVLIIDDFLANGAAARGLMDLVDQAGAQLLGIGVAIEKGFQRGGQDLRAQNIWVESLAVIAQLQPLLFREPS
ncbi:MAG: xanthine phosphoribosyltransferase [Oscillospiraceae bacterium]|jgi:xanthine phosphoribosyltransferase|nr:xanthine phosphoribosyltransferase [Oscillospiraceae bacterium]